MSSFTVLLFVVCALLTTTLSIRVKRVVGGAPYEKGRYPFHVSLWYMGSNNFYTANTPDLHHTCGGSLIAEDWILTSAACFDDHMLPGVGDPNNWEVYVGMHAQRDAASEAHRVEIKEIFVSPEYNLTESYGDNALLQLNKSVDLTHPNVGLVAYNMDPDRPENGTKCTVIGWGMLAEVPFGAGSNLPHAAEVPIYDLEKCEEAFAPKSLETLIGPVRIDEGSLCAGREEGGVDACSGDSGSPLLCYFGDIDGDGVDDPVVVATVTTGYGCARPHFPGIYTRVSSNADWITETIMNN